MVKLGVASFLLKINGLRLTAITWVVAHFFMVLGQVAIQSEAYPEGAEVATARFLYNENKYIDQNRLLRGGEAAVAPLSTPRSLTDYENLTEISIGSGLDKRWPA